MSDMGFYRDKNGQSHFGLPPRCCYIGCQNKKYPGADTCAEEHGGRAVAEFRRQAHAKPEATNVEEVAITYAEYVEWKRSFHTRMDRIKEQQMNVRALLNDLKDVTTAGKSLDELVALSAFAQATRAAYQTHSVEVPEFLDDANRVLNGEIASRNRDALEARLRELNQADAALRTPGERRAEIAKERERLEQALGRKSAEPLAAGS